jgi:hypothetical protein
MKELYKVLKDHKNDFMHGLVNASYRQCYREEAQGLLSLSSSDLDECGGENVVRVYLINTSFYSPLSKAMSKLLQAKLVADQIGLETANQNIETELGEEQTNQGDKMLSDKLTVLINDIDIAMKALQYGLYRGKVYKKVELAKYTFTFKCEARVFVSTLASNEHFKARLLREMKKVTEILADPYCEVIRPLTIDYNLIEVMNGQCWSIKEKKFIQNAIHETSIGLVSPRAYCKYDSSKPSDPKYFKEILENSLTESQIAMFCSDFLKLLEYNKKRHKDKVPCLVGDANSGKTSLFLPMLGIIHHSNIATVTKQRAFNKAMITRFTEVIFIDEATVSTMDVDDWKTLTQGGYMANDVKYHTAKSFINRCPMLITSQNNLDFKKEDKPAMDRRLTTYTFKSLPNPQKGPAEWLRRHPMECIVWASTKARAYTDEDDEDDDLTSDDDEGLFAEEGTLKQSEKDALRALSLTDILEDESSDPDREPDEDNSRLDSSQDMDSQTRRITRLEKELEQCSVGSLRQRQVSHMLHKEKRLVEQERQWTEDKRKRRKEILKEKGVSTQNVDLLPENNDLPLPTPIANQLQEYEDRQEENAKEARKETAENVFQNSWLQETEKKLHQYVMQFQSETNPVTRSGVKGMIEILREKLRAHHSTLGTLRMKEALDERRRICTTLGLLDESDQHLVTSLTDILPIKNQFTDVEPESSDDDQDIFITPCARIEEIKSVQSSQSDSGVYDDFQCFQPARKRASQSQKGSKRKTTKIQSNTLNCYFSSQEK